MTSKDLLGTIARMTPYTIDSNDDMLEDAVTTLNRLIEEARKITAAATPGERARELLADSLQAWQGEEDSVREEHAEHIAELEAFFEELDKQQPPAPAPLIVWSLTTDGDNQPTETTIHTTEQACWEAVRVGLRDYAKASQLASLNAMTGEQLREAWEELCDGCCIVSEHIITRQEG